MEKLNYEKNLFFEILKTAAGQTGDFRTNLQKLTDILFQTNGNIEKFKKILNGEALVFWWIPISPFNK